MSIWSLYFLAKLGLYYSHVLGLHWWPNLLLALALAWPLASTRLRLLRHALAVPLALMLAYYDSYLPAWPRLLEQAGALSGFSSAYVAELAGRLIVWPALLALAALVLAYVLLAHRVRFASLVFLGLACAAVIPVPGRAPVAPDEGRFIRAGETNPDALAAAGTVPAQLDGLLEAFYAAQHGKTVSFSRAGIPRYDLILLSVCSLSSDDLEAVHLRDAPVLGRFDIVFRRFNSAATYSGPAVLRLLHGTCGQTPQAQLYGGSASDECYLFRNLAADGYAPALLLNHDGQFDGFAQQLRSQGGLDVTPLDNRAGPVAMQAFDGSPVRADYPLLSAWWHQHLPPAAAADRNLDAGSHVALLYNTITLHDGNRVPGQDQRSSRETYAPRLRQLLADLGRFLDEIEASGRPTVVVLIPEHGAALRAENGQVSGLREMPTPAITQVPVAVKLMGFAPELRAGPNAGGGPIVVNQPSSYLALTALLAGLNHIGPQQASRASLQRLTAALPASTWVAENAGNVLLSLAGANFLRAPDGQWLRLQEPAPGAVRESRPHPGPVEGQ